MWFSLIVDEQVFINNTGDFLNVGLAVCNHLYLKQRKSLNPHSHIAETPIYRELCCRVRALRIRDLIHG